MPLRSLANGRVSISPLPACDPGAADQPPTKRLFLEKGELAQIHNGPEAVRMIACTELLAGKPRGNHYHRLKHERLYLMRGSCRLVVEDVQSHVREEAVLAPGDLVSIEPGVAHALEPLEDGHAIEFAQVEHDPADTIPYSLVRG